MKLLKSLLLFLLLTSCGTGVNNLKTTFNDNIDSSVSDKIDAVQDKLFTAIKNEDVEGVKSCLSPSLLESSEFKAELFVEKISPLIITSEFVVVDRYYSTGDISGEESVKSISGDEREDQLTINKLRFYSNESYNLFLRSTNPGLQYLFFISLSPWEGEWKINILRVGNYAVDGMTLPGLYEKAALYREEGNLTAATVYALAMNKLQNPAPFLQYKKQDEYMAFMKSAAEELHSYVLFPFPVEDTEFFGLDLVFTRDKGLVPVLSYKTDTVLDSEDADKEALELKKGLTETLTGIDKAFDLVILRAYNEKPVDQKKSYAFKTLVLNLKGE